jgi:hypothetical protein
MLRAIFRDMRPFSQLMFSVFIIIVSFLVFIVVSLVIAIPVWGMDLMTSITTPDANNPQSIIILKYFQVVQALGVFIVPPFILAWLFQGEILVYLKLNKGVNLATLLLVALLSITAMPLINLTGELNSNLQLPEWLSGVETWMKNTEEKAAELTELFLKVDGISGLFFNIFMIAVLPAIGEELLFRGVVQRIFTHWTKNSHWGIWIAAILFSALHMQFYGFIPRMLLGALFGYLLLWSGSMWLPIAAHFLNNAVAVVGMYMIDKGTIKPEFEEIGSTGDSVYLSVVSIAFVALLLWLIKREYKPAVDEQRLLQ